MTVYKLNNNVLECTSGKKHDWQYNNMTQNFPSNLVCSNCKIEIEFSSYLSLETVNQLIGWQKKYASITMIISLVAIAISLVTFVVSYYIQPVNELNTIKFNECLKVVEDSSSNWNMRKETIKFCEEAIK